MYEMFECANEDLREEMKISNIPVWKIALEYGYTDSAFSKKLRKEFSKSEKEKILKIIEKLQNETEE